MVTPSSIPVLINALNNTLAGPEPRAALPRLEQIDTAIKAAAQSVLDQPPNDNALQVAGQLYHDRWPPSHACLQAAATHWEGGVDAEQKRAYLLETTEPVVTLINELVQAVLPPDDSDSESESSGIDQLLADHPRIADALIATLPFDDTLFQRTYPRTFAAACDVVQALLAGEYGEQLKTAWLQLSPALIGQQPFLKLLAIHTAKRGTFGSCEVFAQNDAALCAAFDRTATENPEDTAESSEAVESAGSEASDIDTLSEWSEA